MRLASWALEVIDEPVDDRDRAATDDVEHAVVGDDRGGVLVDADPEQVGRLGDQHQQPAVAVALGEVLVDHGVGEQPEAGGELGHPLLGGRAAGAERDHVGRLDAGAGRRAADRDAVAVGLHDRRRRRRCR